MSLSQSLEQRQTQSLVLTPQLKQLLRIVQMNNAELSAHIETELEQNPLLERAADIEPPDTAPEPSLSSLGSGVQGSDSDFDLMANVAEQPSLVEHLTRQIVLSEEPLAIRHLALNLAGELLDDGYLGTSLEEFTERSGAKAVDADRALRLVQDCEPTGVGARNLKECLRLQLQEQNFLIPEIELLLDQLTKLSTADPAKLCEDVGVSKARLATLMGRIRALDPKPGLKFTGGTASPVTPDIFVRADPMHGWRVDLNTDALPRILVNNQYTAFINTLKEEDRAYVSECRAKANWLVKAMEQRARTILNVAMEIVKRQSGFFAGGVADLAPLTQRNVADALSIHESTVSRVVSSKYLSCKQGNFPLQFFFSQNISQKGRETGVSSTAVQEQIRKLIAQESVKKPLSDDKIVTILKDTGLVIARRTVTKYREALKLPSSVQRRRMNALK